MLVQTTHRSDNQAFFRTPHRQFGTEGQAAALPSGPLDTLGQRARTFFSTPSTGPALLVGALPFDRARNDYLIQPTRLVDAAAFAPAAIRSMPEPRWTLTQQPDPHGYAVMVAHALEAIAAAAEDRGGLRKVVLARRLLVETGVPLDYRTVLARLGGDPSVTAFAVPLPANRAGEARMLVGATPELLLTKTGRTIRSNPLAGSSKRLADASSDRLAAEALERSDKNRREHAAVVEAILDTLAPYCDQLTAPQGPALRSTATMWHLGTQIEGRLRDESVSCADLVAQLHPTPAVCGFPREAAQALIADLEPFERGYYAGAVGWLDGNGDGEWHIALRCGEISGSHIALYAGAGIVPGSDPVAEAEETSAKFVAFLRALGIDENGNSLDEANI